MGLVAQAVIIMFSEPRGETEDNINLALGPNVDPDVEKFGSEISYQGIDQESKQGLERAKNAIEHEGQAKIFADAVSTAYLQDDLEERSEMEEPRRDKKKLENESKVK